MKLSDWTWIWEIEIRSYLSVWIAEVSIDTEFSTPDPYPKNFLYIHIQSLPVYFRNLYPISILIQGGHASPQICRKYSHLCFERRISKQNSVIRLKLNILVYTAEYWQYTLPKTVYTFFIFRVWGECHGTVTTPFRTLVCPIMVRVNTKTIHTVRHVYLTTMTVLLLWQTQRFIITLSPVPDL